MELPFKVLEIYSKEMDEKHKPKTVFKYLEDYLGNHNYTSLFCNEEDKKNENRDTYNNTDNEREFKIHCYPGRRRSYSDLYSLVHTYFKKHFDVEVSFEEMIYFMTLMYKRNNIYLKKIKGIKSIPDIQSFYCQDVRKFVNRNDGSSDNITTKTYNYRNLYNETYGDGTIPTNGITQEMNPILSSLHYLYRSKRYDIDYLKKIKTNDEVLSFIRNYESSFEGKNDFSDGIHCEHLNKAYELGKEKLNYKIIATYGSLKYGFHNNVLLNRDDVIDFGEFELIIPYKMVDLGDFPGLIKSKENNSIQMELFAVPEEVYKQVESLEGYPNFYTKNIVSYNKNEMICELFVDNIEFYVLNENNGDYSSLKPVVNNYWDKK